MNFEYLKPIDEALLTYSKEQPLYLLLFYISQIILWQLISRLTKEPQTNKTVIVFTAWYYNENTKEVLKWFIKNTDYTCFWLARNLTSYKDVKRDEKDKAIYAYALPSLIQLRSVDVFVTADSFFTIIFPNKKPSKMLGLIFFKLIIKMEYI